jgi:hypothetical protein
MISIDQAKALQPGEQIQLTRNGEVWTIEKLEEAGGKLVIHANNGRVSSFIPQDRLGMFDVMPTAPKTKQGPDVEDAIKQLRPGMDAAFKEVQAETDRQVEAAKTAEYSEVTDETGIEMRIEKQFVEEPPLTKPEKKSRKKK